MDFLKTVLSLGLKSIGVLFKGILWGLLIAGLITYGLSYLGDSSAIKTILLIGAFLVSGALVTFIYIVVGVVKLINKAAQPAFSSCAKHIEEKIGSDKANAEPEEMFNMTKGYLCEKSAIVNRAIGHIEFSTIQKTTAIAQFVAPSDSAINAFADFDPDQKSTRCETYVSSLSMLWEIPANLLIVKIVVLLVLVVGLVVLGMIYL